MNKFLTIVALFGFAASAIAAEPSISVEARQRYPWNGLVDLKFTISGTSGTKYDTSFTAKDVVGGTNITMKTIRKSNGVAVNVEKEKLEPGTYNWVWDAAADLPKDFVCQRVKIVATTLLPYPTSGLKVYWPFDGNGNDKSGNGKNLSGNSVSYVADRFGELGKSVYFDGSVSLTMNNAIGVSKTMTFSFWAKPQKSDYYDDDIRSGYGFGYGSFGYAFDDFPMIIMPSYNKTRGEIGIALGMGRLELFQVSGSSGYLCCYYTRRGVYGDGWHHYAITISNSGTPVVYIDGVKVTGTATSFYDSSLYIATALNFGGRATNSYYNYSSPGNQAYKGYIDDFMIYDRVLSETEIKNLYGGWTQTLSVYETEIKTYPTSGLKVYWPFDGNGNDKSGNGKNLSGNSVSYVADRFGELGKSVYFDGSVSLTMNNAIGVSKTMTFSFWAKPQKSDYYDDDIRSGYGFGYGSFGYAFDDFPMIIMPSYNKTRGEIGIALGMGRLELFQVSGSSGYLCCYYTRRGVYGDGWHHYAITISNSGTPVVYIDGVKVTGTATSFYDSSLYIATALNFGGRATNSYYNYSSPGNQAYKGYIDDFMIYDRVLSEMEIKNLVKFKAE